MIAAMPDAIFERWRIDVQTSALGNAGGQNQLIRQLMELARANASQEDTSAGASSAQSTQGEQQGSDTTLVAPPAPGTTPADMFSGQTLGALTSAQEGAGGWRQQMDSIVANSMVSQLDSNGDGSLSLSEIQSALGGSSGTGASATSSSTSTNTPSTLDGLASAFASVDTNGDGQLSSDELTNALNQMNPGQGGVHGHHGHHHHGGGGSLASDIENALSALTASLNGSGGASSGSTSSNLVSTLDGLTTTAGASSSTSTSPSTNTASTLDGLTNADIAQALQAFPNSLAQSQAAHLNALGQSTSPTSVTA
jgi:hypothetical protein